MKQNGEKMKAKIISALLAFIALNAHAATLTVEMVDLSANKIVGIIEIQDTEYGAVFTPNLSGLPSQNTGLHGFHIHTNPSCEPTNKDGKITLGGAAGSHYDPEKTGKHGHPWTKDNHLGDLPAIYLDKHGKITSPVLAPRLKTSYLEGRSVMIHVGGDNYSDHPHPLGGGGARMICGVITKKK